MLILFVVTLQMLKKNVLANRYRIFEGMGLQFSSVLRPQHNSTSVYQFGTVLVQALIIICTMIKKKFLFLNFTEKLVCLQTQLCRQV